MFQRGFRTQRSTRLLLILLAACFAGLSVFNQKLTYYLIHILPWYVALTAFYVEWLWGKFPALRAVLALAIIGLVGVETGGILLKSQVRSKIIPEEQAAIDFARAQAGQRDRIVGSAALIYGFDFDRRLQDDPRLGSTSGKRADVIIADPIYRDFWQEAQPADQRAVKERLSRYQLAFDNGTCQVYVRRPYPRASC